MSFARYPEYKDSGVEWLGEVPTHWDISRLGFEAWVRARLGWKGLKAEEYVDDGIVFLATPNIKGAEIDFKNVNYISQERYDESPEIKLSVGDVLLAKDGSTLGIVNVVKVLPKPATVNSSIAVITPLAAMTGGYLRYIFNSSFMEQMIQKTKGGMGVPHLFQADLNKFYIPVPPIHDQEAVTTFLDRETAKIDALVAEQEKLIALLQEKRQAVISHAVTKGLNASVSTKDSSVEWLGEVARHWEVVQFRRYVYIAEGQVNPELTEFREMTLIAPNHVESGTGRILQLETAEQQSAESGKYQCEEGDVIYSKIRPGLRKVCLAPSACLCSADMYPLRPKIGLISKFLMWFMLSEQFSSLAVLESERVAMPKINRETLNEVTIVVPPVHEQVEIDRFLTNATSKLDALIAEALTAITLLQVRRTVLISAAITGQIDVRG